MSRTKLFSAAVIVASLGYFVDIYDLLLFSIVRVQSLRLIGFAGSELEVGAWLSNIQMTGLMVGGILWGVVGDKKGRLSVLFGSIFLYSVANFINGYSHTLTHYACCRFFAGLGLAGELGAGITLVSEVLPSDLRGYGTTLVATIGVSGAIVGGYVAQIFSWRVAFQIGGVLGLLLLLLRIGVAESGIYQDLSGSRVKRGNFLSLFTHRERFKRFALCVLSGVPIWFAIGVLVTYSPEFARIFEVTGTIGTAQSVMACYLGFVIGDFGFGIFSQWVKSRNRAVKTAIGMNFFCVLIYLLALRGVSVNLFYFWCVLIGATAGYWAVICTMTAEQFGTNLRATATTAVPNFIRFSLVPMNLIMLFLKSQIGLVNAALFVGVVVLGIAYFSIRGLQEPYGKDLNFVETD